MNLKVYKEKVKSKEIKSYNNLRTHLTTYIAVNIGIFILNMMTSPSFPWFLFVTGGWGIGMVSHWGERFIALKNLDDVINITDIDPENLKELIKSHRLRHNFYQHIISNIAVSIYLLTINIITSTAFMWSFIPILAMGIGVASHWASYTNRKSYEEPINIDPNDISDILTNSQLQRAIVLRESILSTIVEIRHKFKDFASDILPKIDSYVETIQLLTQKEEDLDELLKESSTNDLILDKEELKNKKGNTDSPVLITEYNRLIDDIDNQITTIKKLEEDKELLKLKITSSINSLKHLNLELVGIKSQTTLEDSSILDDFDKKSSELALYYKDLLESYNELYQH